MEEWKKCFAVDPLHGLSYVRSHALSCVVRLEKDINWRAITLIFRTFHSLHINPNDFCDLFSHRFSTRISVYKCVFRLKIVPLYGFGIFVHFSVCRIQEASHAWIQLEYLQSNRFCVEKEAGMGRVWETRMRLIRNMRHFESASFESHNKLFVVKSPGNAWPT